jgi:hypothetical protein
VAVRFGSLARIGNRLPKSSNFWDGTAVYFPWINTGSYDALATYTVPSGGVSSITFAGIPNNGYKHLQIRGSFSNSSGSVIRGRFNSDSGNNYSRHYVYGDGGSTAAGNDANFDYATFGYNAGTAANYSASVIDILDYTSTSKNKTVKTLTGSDNNGSGLLVLYSSGWYNTSAINSITITSTGSNFTQYSQFVLYGVKG